MPFTASVSVLDPSDRAALDEVTTIWSAAREEAGASASAVARGVAEDRMAVIAARPDVQVLVARHAGEMVGFAILSTSPISGLIDAPAMRIEQMYVVPGARKRGVASAMLSAVARLAERNGLEQIIGFVPASRRDANRFFARFGFGSFLVTRSTPTAALMRRLTQDQAIDREVVLRRRLLRRAADQLPIA